MHIKTLLILISVGTGFVIALFTAVMTYIIIDAPIGMKMFSEISLTVLITLPVIGGFSYLTGRYLASKFDHIAARLNLIREEAFLAQPYHEKIREIDAIHDAIFQLSARLEKSITALQGSNAQLKNTIKSLSHDIKTPLTIMDGYLEELEDGLVQEAAFPKVLETLKRETDYINELSSEVIAYLESQEYVNHIEPIPLYQLVTSEVLPLLRIKEGVCVVCEVEKETVIPFNRTALKKILVNLLHNAICYTGSGEIRVRGDGLTLSIEDTGRGIAPQFADRIFEPFFCIEESRNRSTGGFGLGLSIARNLAETNGYHLSLDTHYTGGSRFILTSESTGGLDGEISGSDGGHQLS